MYRIYTFNHITKKEDVVFESESKNEVKKKMKNLINTSEVKKCGYDYFKISDRSIEYRFNF